MYRILLVWRFPNPLDFPLTTYNTTQSNFAEVLREIYQKIFLISYYGKVSKMPKKNAIETNFFHSVLSAYLILVIF
jgi:hypothetical protein